MNIDAVMWLAAAGDRALEVTLRTPAAYEAIASADAQQSLFAAHHRKTGKYITFKGCYLR